MHYIQCFPLYNVKALRRLIRYANHAGAEILLDLEDSVCDVSSPELTLVYKTRAREILLDLVGQLTELPKVHIRINAISSIHFNNDMACLAALPDVRWESIFIPKAESYHDMIETINVLTCHYIRFKYLSPIIETVTGYDFFINSFINHPALGLKVVYFGNYDYNLSKFQYPLIEQGQEKYWDTVLPLINKIETMGLSFGNSPYAPLGDLETFKSSLQKLALYCKQPAWQVCLSLNQTKLAKAFTENNECAIPHAESSNKISALEAGAGFQSLAGRSFAYNYKTKNITTPHEYLLFNKTQAV